MKNIIQNFYQAFNSHDPQEIGRHLTKDFTQTTPYGGSINKGQLLVHLEKVYKSIENKNIRPIRWFIDRDEAAVIIESTGKHNGLFMGIQGKGNQFRITAAHTFKTRGNKIKHWRVIYNADQLKRDLIKK